MPLSPTVYEPRLSFHHEDQWERPALSSMLMGSGGRTGPARLSNELRFHSPAFSWHTMKRCVGGWSSHQWTNTGSILLPALGPPGGSALGGGIVFRPVDIVFRSKYCI